MKDLASCGITKSLLNSRIIETWLNETLAEAAHMDIPGMILKPENKKPMTRYGIDKN